MKTKNDSPHLPIKLHAQHHAHIEVISAHMQDAIVSTSSLIHEINQKSFKLLGNRFCWEKFLNVENPIKARVHVGIHFDYVINIQKKNIQLHHPEKLYNLIAMQSKEDEVLLTFSEYAEIRLTVEQISCKMADLHEPYPTQFSPSHPEKNT